MQLLWPYFRQIRRRDKDRAALPKMRGGDGILCDRRYCDGAGAEAVGKAEGKNGREVNMIPLGFQLGHNDFEMEYKGKKLISFYRFNQKGSYRLKFSFISVDSPCRQAIVFHLDEFEGKIYAKGKELKKEKRKFPQLIFPEDEMPKEFELDVILKEGDIGISNGYEYPDYPGVWDSLIEGCAMYTEEIAPNHLIFHCNDYYNDDDLNDFVFSMEINKLEEK